jgi:DNA-binding transcriptional regulator GbsR (MarR family)
MKQQPATVKTHVSRAADSVPPGKASPAAVGVESIRLALADAWGEMGASWGVAPAIARVHAYLMAQGGALTEREVREALGLSHRAASMALEAAVGWGIVETVPEPRRVGKRGPAGTAYLAVSDHFRWFSRVIAYRKAREGDPVIAVLETTLRDAEDVARTYSADAEAAALRDWIATFLEFVRLFDRAIGLVPAVEPVRLQHVLELLAQVPDETVLRLVNLLGELPDEDVLKLANGLGRMAPRTARRATRLMVGVIRTVAR